MSPQRTLYGTTRNARMPMNFASLKKLLNPACVPAVPVLFSLFVAMVFWITTPNSFQSPEDADYQLCFLPVAHNINNGEGITIHGKPAIEYPPGYPLLLSIILFPAKITPVHEELLLRIWIACLFAFGSFLIFIIARMLWDPYRALIASLIWSCYPLNLWTIKWPSTELPFAVIFYVAAFLFLKGWNTSKYSAYLFLAGGFAIGLSMLIRPIAIGAGVVVAVLVMLGRRHVFGRRMVLGACLIAGNLFAVLPWESWAFSQTHQILPLCRSRAFFSFYDGLTFAVLNSDGFRKGVKVPDDVKDLMNKIVSRYGNGNHITDLKGFLCMQAKARPLAFSKLVVIKSVRSWYGTNSNRNEKSLAIMQALFVSLLLLSITLLWRKRPETRYIVVAGMVLVCYFWGMTISVLSIVRYMTPIVGATVIFFPGISLIQFNSRHKKTPNLSPQGYRRSDS